MNVLMVGVDEKRTGGMWTVAKIYIDSKEYQNTTNLQYIATSTSGNILKRSLKMMQGYIEIMHAIKHKKIDIVHIHMAERGSTFRKGKIIEYCHARGIKTVLHMHAGPFADWFYSLSDFKQNKIKRYLACVDTVLVLGDYWEKKLSEIITRPKIRVLYTGVPMQPVNSYSGEEKNIVFMGRINEFKGIWDFLKAVQLINRDLTDDVKVLICGEDETGILEEEIVKYDLKDRIQLCGWVSGEEKNQVYKSAMLVVLPTYVEGLSMTVLEAMSYGIPVITTYVTTMPELLGEITTLVPTNDPIVLAQEILTLYNSKNERIRISKAEYMQINAKFSEKNMIEQTLKIYETLSKDNSRGKN